MKYFKSALAAILALSALLCLSACGSKSSPEDALAEAQEKLAAVESMSYNMVMDMEMGAEGESFAIKSSITADCVADPLTMKMDINMDMGELGAMDYAMYAAEEDGKYVSYISMYGAWYKQELAGLEDLEQYNATASMDTYLSSYSSITENGSEEINGSKATRYDCIVSSDALDDVMEASGAFEQLTTLGITEDEAKEMLTGIGDMPYSIWIDDAEKLPVRYEMDMSGIMDALIQNMAQTLGDELDGIEIIKMTISMDISNFNGVGSIEIPAEALAAESIA